jgi:hypothetical protein
MTRARTVLTQPRPDANVRVMRAWPCAYLTRHAPETGWSPALGAQMAPAFHDLRHEAVR